MSLGAHLARRLAPSATLMCPSSALMRVVTLLEALVALVLSLVTQRSALTTLATRVESSSARVPTRALRFHVSERAPIDSPVQSLEFRSRCRCLSRFPSCSCCCSSSFSSSLSFLMSCRFPVCLASTTQLGQGCRFCYCPREREARLAPPLAERPPPLKFMREPSSSSAERAAAFSP